MEYSKMKFCGKYDKYREQCLTANQEGGQPESWHYYHYNFDIFDDDPKMRTAFAAAAANSRKL